MNKEAIQQIQESANIPALIDQLDNVGTEIPTLIAPQGMAIHNLEKYMTYPSRYRMNYSTSSVDDFVAYNSEFDNDGATCFVDSEKMTAQTIFDLGTVEFPEHKEHKADLSLKKTAAFKALLRCDGDKYSQKTAAEFLEDWEDNIDVLNQNGEHMTVKQAVKSLRDLTIESAREVNSQVNDFSETMSAMERIEAKNQHSLPSYINFNCVPYLALQERTFTIRLSIITGGDRPAIGFRIVRIDAIEEEIVLEFKELLCKAFSELSLDTYIGQA
jgi:uncharacterized protein YfdQ (DUF2303 family)